MGLPGTGKTTLAKKLQTHLGECIWYNADKVRTKYNDWDFSNEGRLRQANRMADLANTTDYKYVISDFVCPTEETRAAFEPDFIIWMDTYKISTFSDTNKVFNPPPAPDIIISSFDYSVNEISDCIKALNPN